MPIGDRETDTSEDTLSASRRFQFEGELLLPTLTILWHPDRRCIGASTPVLWNRAGEFGLSRWAPLFQQDDSSEFSLDDRRISRNPLLLKQLAEGISIQPPSTTMPVQVDEEQIESPLTVNEQSLEDGVAICLGRRVALCLHRAPPQREHCPTGLDLIGSGHRMRRVRQQIRRAAHANASVLIRGESGTGKELVARAIHQLSGRSERPMVSVNMATLGGELAAAELFGVRQGAYTGARTSRPGLICEADGSTLFMDEIGDASPSVQVMLLRVLEDGRLRPLGDSRERSVDVRFIAATDRPLEPDVERPFNQPLRRRLEAVCIQLPPLRQRREDFGELLAGFVTEAEAELGHPIHIPADLVCTLAMHPWPGNVRELRNFVTRLAIHAEPDGTIRWDDELAEHLHIDPRTEEAGTPPAPNRIRYRDPATVSESDLLRALNDNGWRVMPAARSLGVSRTSMYALLKQSLEVRPAETIPEEEIYRVMEQGPDLDAWATKLKTPREALKRRISALEPDQA
ncbi:sigma 54-interacting transcriptional regulator [Microbulbifer sp.]|uniref:sigma 54-interacting transcriptional regulator n=1 Tax=Microbulbifer sp. TaxID=1908541 RepID=UPI003F2B73A4